MFFHITIQGEAFVLENLVHLEREELEVGDDTAEKLVLRGVRGVLS